MPGWRAYGDEQLQWTLELPRPAQPTPSPEELLAFERRHEHTERYTKQYLIRRDLGISEVRYVALRNRLLDDPKVQALDPELLARLRERRSALRARRTRGEARRAGANEVVTDKL